MLLAVSITNRHIQRAIFREISFIMELTAIHKYPPTSAYQSIMAVTIMLDILLMLLLQFTDQHCPPDEDDWGLIWLSTEPGMTRTQPCPGEDDTGMLLEHFIAFMCSIM